MQLTGAGRVPPSILVLMLAVTWMAGCLPPPTTRSAPSGATSPSTAPPASSGPASASAQAGVSPEAFDACGLMTPAEVSGIVGGPEPVAKAVPAGGWVAGQCAWSSPKAAFLVSVGTASSIAAVGDPGVSGVESKLAEFQQRMRATGDPRPIPGIGDAAVLAKAGMAAYKGDLYVEVTNLRLTEGQMIDVVKLALAGS